MHPVAAKSPAAADFCTEARVKHDVQHRRDDIEVERVLLALLVADHLHPLHEVVELVRVDGPSRDVPIRVPLHVPFQERSSSDITATRPTRSRRRDNETNAQNETTRRDASRDENHKAINHQRYIKSSQVYNKRETKTAPIGWEACDHSVTTTHPYGSHCSNSGGASSGHDRCIH